MVTSIWVMVVKKPGIIFWNWGLF